MDGKLTEEQVIEELFMYAREIMESKKIFPYVSFVVRDGEIIARGFNQERETKDLSMQDEVVSIREAINKLGTGDLSGSTMYSFFEPTILGFDICLWVNIRDLVWCINARTIDRPITEHYNHIAYSPTDFAKDHPGKVMVKAGVAEVEAMKLISEAREKGYYPELK